MADSVDLCVSEMTSRYPEIDPDVEGVVDRLSAIHKHMHRVFEKTLTGHGLSHGEYRLLLRLATRTENRRMSAGQLSKILLLSSGAMTNRLDKMEAAGLVRRVPDPSDRRGVLVELTDKGEALLDTAVIASARDDKALVASLTADERNQLNGLLTKILGDLEERIGDDDEIAASLAVD